MGNRCVITTRENFENDGVGIYMHWNGGRDSVEPLLKYCELKGYRSPDTDCYGWARLCQVIGNALGGTLSVGVDKVSRLDCDNYDNGVYIIEGWKIVGRKYFRGAEQNAYDFNGMLEGINEAMPKDEQLDPDFFKAEEVPRSMLCIGDTLFVYDELYGRYDKLKVVGMGADEVRNGTNVKDMPYVDKYSKDEPESNINNYLRCDTYRVVRPALPQQMEQMTMVEA